MTDSRIPYLLVGGFVLAMALILLGSLAILMGRTGPTQVYSLVLANVGGLKPGTQVLFAGYPIGQVTAIVPAGERGEPMRFRLRVEVQRGWPIPEDSVARVAAPGLLAAVTIDIQAGNSSTLLAPGAEISAHDGASLLAVMDALAAELQAVTRHTVVPMLNDLHRTVQWVQTALTSDGQHLLTQVGALLETLTERTPRFADNLVNLTETIQRDLVSPENIASVRTTITQLQDASDSAQALTVELHAAAGQMKALTGTLDRVVKANEKDIAAAVGHLHYSLDIVARHVDAIAYSLDGTGRNLLEFSRNLRQNPGLLLRAAPGPDTGGER